MPKVQFRVSYSIPDGKRNEYVNAVETIRAFYATTDVQYNVYEVKNKHNHFEEVYVYQSLDAYEASDDPQSTQEIALHLDKIYSLAKNVEYGVALELA
jgi:hypothetical protein